jgi:hnRNP-L/PTB/hephaestus splicing factor
VAFLHNLSEQATPDMLFNLFSIYGNVQRVKIFFKRRDMGLVQYETHQQAINAKDNMNNVVFLGKPLLVSISRNGFINMPTGEKRMLCRDYTDSPFHRYKIQGSKNFQHMFPPSCILHLSNLTERMDEKFFRDFFSAVGELVGFKFLGSERRMALAKFSSIDDSINILVKYHNENINGRYLKVSFSKASSL